MSTEPETPRPLPDLSLPRVAERLAARPPRRPCWPWVRSRAAVALVLRYERAAPDVLLMLRAERACDRWSGQVALPGGREDPGDPDLVATAVRETREEVGLDLARAGRLLGRLDPLQAVAKGAVLPLSIAPHVFVQTAAAPLVLGEEAADAFWLPLDRVVAGELSGRCDYGLGPARVRLPCWRYEGHVIWGLTYRMIAGLLEVVS